VQNGDQEPSRLHILVSRSAAAAATAAAALLVPVWSPPAAAAAAAPQAATTTVVLASSSAQAAANLPADVLATALVSLSKGASLERLTGGGDEGQPQTGPALYVTARVGQRGRVLASVRVPLVGTWNVTQNPKTHKDRLN